MSETIAREQGNVDRIAYDPETAHKATGRPKPRIRQAIKDGELMARWTVGGSLSKLTNCGAGFGRCR